VPLTVHKFGGTSIADAAHIKAAAKRIIKTYSAGNKVVVVVSARGKMTDELLELAYEINDNPSTRELDMLLSTGEQMSGALMAMAIHSLGYPATAVALAAMLKADTCDIYTDVDGIYTADPRIVPEARKLTKISYDEILELASMGAQVVHVRSIEFAKNYNVPIRVRPSFNDGTGTLICKEVSEMEKIVVSGATVTKNEAKITIIGVYDKPGQAAKIFQELAKENVNVDMIIQNIGAQGLTDVTFTVLKEDLPQALATTERIKEEIKAKKIIADDKIAKLSVVGVGMRSHCGIAEMLFSALSMRSHCGIAEMLFSTLSNEKINIQMISTSEIKISCVIEEGQAERALIAVHRAFGLDKESQAFTQST
jgi:aspartate kinase